MEEKSPFKKSSLNEMCNQVKSAPVVFTKTDGTECLAFYNDQDSVEATKLYIMFPDCAYPKYIEYNDLYNLRNCIKHDIDQEKAATLYAKVSRHHKEDTVKFFMSLIGKAPEPKEHPKYATKQEFYSKKHACGLVGYNGSIFYAIMKDLKDKEVAEFITKNTLEYNVTLDNVFWAATISSKEYTALKVKMKELYGSF